MVILAGTIIAIITIIGGGVETQGHSPWNWDVGVSS
jgi:hypothetical protein